MLAALPDPRSCAAPLLALALGAANVASFAPLGLWWLAPLTLAPLFALWQDCDSPRRAALLGFAFGLGHFGAGVSWIFISLQRFGGMPVPVAALSTALFCAYLALYPALAGSLQARLPRTAWRLLAAMPGLWVLGEWMRSWMLTGFPWIAQGYAHTDGPLAGFAPLSGVFGVGLAGALLAGLLVALATGPRGVRIRAACALALLLATGGLLQQVEWTRPQGGALRVSLVQGNIPQDMKFDPEAYAQTLRTYEQLVASSAGRLVLLPETAIPRFLDLVDPAYLERLAATVRARGADLLMGIPAREPGGRYFNAAVSLGTAPTQYYAKVHLVPLGEFVPPEFGWILSVLRVPLSNFSAGNDAPQPLSVAGQLVAVNICYEDAFGAEIARQLPEAGVLANLSNVAWFGDSLAPEQHLQIARMRSIETGRPSLRATNTGVTAAVDAHGRVIARLPGFTRGVLEAEVTPHAGATPYVRFGDAPALLLALLACALAVGAALRRQAA